MAEVEILFKLLKPSHLNNGSQWGAKCVCFDQ